ncbi:MAG: DinB family protein [Phyllobacterium sp.]
MKKHFEMFAAYNAWANEQLYDAVSAISDDEYRRDMGAFFKSLHGTLNHLLVSDRIWMYRFTRQGQSPKSLDAILFDDFENLQQARRAEDQRIIDWIDGMSPEDIAGRFVYTTVTDMRTISQRLSPALAHLFNHQAHHRGQAHCILTALGHSAPSLDLIRFQRTEQGRQFA